ncbi:hypothetical protein [Capnocytophaga sputigena]|uniref:hypothetical protein n=1 Tax=Capnocytophaga sputigena TaxID=1019 RepID=UPI000BB574F0|nr:hypothetical protein [Capnocytophaga sputigena]PBN46816.1 hypothetical protein CDC50_12605 [Capnocytophaga sputigena]
MKKVIIFIILCCAIIQVQAQTIVVYKVEPRKTTTKYYGEKETPYYVKSLQFVTDYETTNINEVNNILKLKEMSLETDFNDIVEFMKTHHLQTGNKVDEVIDLNKLSKSDIKRQIKKYGSIQVVGWDKTVSSKTPIKDKYDTYLSDKKYVENADLGKIKKTELDWIISPEYTADFITKDVYEIFLDKIQNEKEYYMNSENWDQVVYNASDNKYVMPELQKYGVKYNTMENRKYTIFEYEGNKYAVTSEHLAYEREKYKKEIEEAKLEEEYQKKFEKLPQKYTYIKNGGLDGCDIIQSKSFKMELTIARKELFVEKGVAMLDELEKDIAQIIAIYTQSNKYIPQLEKYSSIYIVKRSRMSSADINAWKAIAKQALNIDLRADKISKKLNEEYAFPFGFEILSKEDKKHDLLTDYIIGARAIIGF